MFPVHLPVPAPVLVVSRRPRSRPRPRPAPLPPPPFFGPRPFGGVAFVASAAFVPAAFVPVAFGVVAFVADAFAVPVAFGVVVLVLAAFVPAAFAFVVPRAAVAFIAFFGRPQTGVKGVWGGGSGRCISHKKQTSVAKGRPKARTPTKIGCPPTILEPDLMLQVPGRKTSKKSPTKTKT